MEQPVNGEKERVVWGVVPYVHTQPLLKHSLTEEPFSSTPVSLNTSDVSEKHSKVLRHSWNAQWNDLRFENDILGIAKLVNEVKIRVFTDQKPYLYKITKEDISFLGLGTIHTLPLSILNLFIKKTIYSCKTLICERYEPSETATEEWNHHYRGSAFDWFDTLTDREQKVLQLISEKGDFEDIDVRIMPDLYELRHYQDAMDFEIQRYFKGQNYPIEGLDTTDEYFHCLSFATKDPKSSLSILRDMIQETIENKGYLNEPDRVDRAVQYLLGKVNETNSFKENGNIIADNQKWWPRLLTLLKQYPKETAVVVGAGHWLGSKGFLNFFLNDGWNVEQYDMYGNLFPVKKEEYM